MTQVKNKKRRAPRQGTLAWSADAATSKYANKDIRRLVKRTFRRYTISPQEFEPCMAQGFMSRWVEDAATEAKNIAFNAYNCFIDEVGRKQLELEPDDRRMYALPTIFERRWGVGVLWYRVHYVNHWRYLGTFRSTDHPLNLEPHLQKFHGELADICRRAEAEFKRARVLTKLVATVRPLVKQLLKFSQGFEPECPA